MKLLYALGILLAIGINDIARINTLKQEAKAAYEAKDYETALEKYQELKDDFNETSDEVALNWAHSLYHLKDTSKAMLAYNELSLTAEDSKIKSIAFNQVGVLHNEMDPSGANAKVALQAFKAALKADPTNAEARYNYEVLKKKIKEQEDQKKDQEQNQDQKKDDQEQKDEEKKDNENKENKEGDQEKKDENSEEENKENEDKQQENKEQQGEEDKDQEKKDGEEKEDENKEGEEQKEEEQKKSEEEKEGEKDDKKEGMPQSAEDKLKELNISPQQAKMLLEAMKDQEVQYLQQLRKRPTKKRQSGKPDW